MGLIECDPFRVGGVGGGCVPVALPPAIELMPFGHGRSKSSGTNYLSRANRSLVERIQRPVERYR